MTRILFVCLGNICRSPTAEGVLRHLLASTVPSMPVEIDSAGTDAYHSGAAPDPRSQRVARNRGIEIGGLRARQVSAEDFRRFDLILAMDQDNLRDLHAIRPDDSRAKLQLFLDYAPHLRRADVPDPYLGDEPDFETVLDLTEAAARGLIAALQAAAGGR
ncbi:MAG: low molecular weight protein-tyrosine-phosphatase [Steroidobacterales bacterium]